MSNTKGSDLAALTGAGTASGDLAVVIDVSDTTMAATGTNKKITLAELAAGLATHGALATDAEVASAVSTHEADTTNVHGITDTSALLANPLAHDFVVTGDGASDLSPDAPSVTLGVEVGGNNNAHIEIASPAATGTAYIDLTEVGSDAKARIQWTAANQRLTFQALEGDAKVAGASLVSGTISGEGGIAIGRNASADDAYHFEAGRWDSWGGDVQVNGLPGGAYFYIYGGSSEIRAGKVTISGVHEMAAATGGNLDLYGGDVVLADAGGEDAYRTQGGHARMAGGSASTLDASPAAVFGGKIVTEGGSGDTGPGGVTIHSPSDQPKLIEVRNGAIGFYGQTPVAQQTGVAVSDAAIHAALVNLGLITA